MALSLVKYHFGKTNVSYYRTYKYGYTLFYVTKTPQNPNMLFDFLVCLEILGTAFIGFNSNSF